MNTQLKNLLLTIGLIVLTVVSVGVLACGAAPASATSVGEAGYAQGWMRALQIISPDAPPEIAKYQCGVFVDGNGNAFPRWCGRFVFVPSSPDLDVRYGVPSRWVKGTLVGERGLSGLDPCQLQAIGLPPGYVQTPLDIADAMRITLDGVRVAFDALPRCPVDVPPPVTTTCELPKVCMVPPGPCVTCPVCPICPTCPPGLPPLSAAEQRAEEIGVLLRPIHQVFAKHSYWRKKLPPWADLWAASKPLVVEILLAKRRFELRAAGER